MPAPITPKKTDLKTSTFGTCRLASISPGKDKLSPDLKTLNVVLSFEEALKINLAIDECVRKLSKYKMSTTTGKRAAVNFTIHFDMQRITINEAKLSKE